MPESAPRGITPAPF